MRIWLGFGLEVYTNNAAYGWWTTAHGNWNCVCIGGLTMGALAILGDDTTNTAPRIPNHIIPTAVANHAQGATPDGSWTETANSWYFGITSHAEIASSHIYVSGNQQLFDYGDHEYSATAVPPLNRIQKPEYALFQRDRPDAAKPWSMPWYDPAVSGAYWNGLALDHYFEDAADSWACMRTSWTDINGWYVAMKAGAPTGHDSHGNLDGGDFVIDFAGMRWAGELGSGDYIADGYFTSEAQDSPRWTYYRTRTEGRNTLVVNKHNQLVTAAPTCKFASSDTRQESSTVFNVPSDSAAMFTTDLTTNYG
ncbi:hypothetical protein M407DRAFT_29688 [Tulasnella calospora MUT 4182]|uniref:Heparinase II/III-like C-terminal domain-containing protein n=1 Tax=Tulasnella calospora MUT 4182 TaxID=1051891 RepID=A0A0C3LGW3_9AGAM|nr:hypothetical protein M407DRAFT_29688 [Tulasnella calospora MUT 4182]